MICPYCGQKLKDIRLPNDSMYPWVHPVDGVCPPPPKTLQLYENRIAKLFDVKPIEGEQECLEKCSSCGFCFHILFFPIPSHCSWRNMEDLILSKHFDREMDQASVKNSKTFVTKLIDKIPLKYPISSFLLAMAILSIYAVPVVAGAGAESNLKLLRQLMPRFPILFIGLAALLIFTKYHSEKMLNLRDSIEQVIGVRDSKKAGWLFARFRYYITGHPKARLNPANFTGFSLLFIWGISALLLGLKNASITSLDLAILNLTRYVEVFPVETVMTLFVIAFWSIASFIIGTAIWIGCSTTVITYWIGTHLPLRLNPSKRSGGCESLGQFALSGIFPMAATGIIPLLFVSEIQLNSSTLKDPFWLYFWVCLLLVFALSLTTMFLISTYSIHKGMERERRNLLARTSLDMRKIYDVLENPRASRDNVFYVSLMNMQLGLNRRIDEMWVWPFNPSMIFQLVFSAMLPLLLFIIELIL